MDNFEALIRLLLEEDGYWTLGSRKSKSVQIRQKGIVQAIDAEAGTGYCCLQAEQK